MGRTLSHRVSVPCQSEPDGPQSLELFHHLEAPCQDLRVGKESRVLQDPSSVESIGPSIPAFSLSLPVSPIFILHAFLLLESKQLYF